MQVTQEDVDALVAKLCEDALRCNAQEWLELFAGCVRAALAPYVSAPPPKKKQTEYPKTGQLIVTDTELRQDMAGMLVVPDLLANRRPGVAGTVLGYVPGHGGDVWYVKHEDETQAVYMYSELWPAPPVPQGDQARVEVEP